MGINLSEATSNKKSDKLGRFFWSIDFYMNSKLTNDDFVNYNSKHVRPTVGILTVGNHSMPLTMPECDKLIETLKDARYTFEQKYRLGLLK